MSDYDTEFHKCLDKGKAIRNKLNKRSENTSNNKPNTQLDDIIKDSLEEFSKMIKALKNLTNAPNISNQELNRRNDNYKKIEEMFQQCKKQMEINQVNLSTSPLNGIDKKDNYSNNKNISNNAIITIENDKNREKEEDNKNFKTKEQFLEYKNKKFEEGDEYLNELHGKTKIIKNHALLINDTLDKQQPLLERMDIDLTRVVDKAKRTENKLANYLEKSSNTCLIYAIIIEAVILLLFFVM